jgi:hypothetical protein
VTNVTVVARETPFSIRVFDSVATVRQVVACWSNQRGWGEAPRLALAGGALLTYAWSAFPHSPTLPVDPTMNPTGDVVGAAGAVTRGDLAHAVGLGARSGYR